jgi:hypothetical protein
MNGTIIKPVLARFHYDGLNGRSQQFCAHPHGTHFTCSRFGPVSLSDLGKTSLEVYEIRLDLLSSLWLHLKALDTPKPLAFIDQSTKSGSTSRLYLLTVSANEDGLVLIVRILEVSNFAETSFRCCHPLNKEGRRTWPKKTFDPRWFGRRAW